MNLSEIRKKAQQEQQDGQQHRAAEPTPTPVAAPVAAEAVVVTPFIPEIPPVQAPLPVTASDPEPVPSYFDPVSLILAGRRDSSEVADPEAEVKQATSQVEAYEECLCFRVSTERYAISIMEIKEITKPREMTEVPRVPDFVAGVISLRGVIVPVFDLKLRLNLAPVADLGKSRIIVIKKGEELFGILVDEVIQVVRVPAASIEMPPAVLEGIDREFVRGIGRHEGRMLILLHLGKILDLSLT